METLTASRTLSSNQANLRRDPVSSPQPRSTGSLRRFVLIAGAVTVVAFLVGFLPRMRDHRLALADNAELGTLTVTVVHPEPAPAMPSLVLSAELRAYVDTTIYARANGYLKQRYVDIGSNVKKGDVLADLDTPELEQQLAGAKADKAQSKAAMDLARTTSERYRDLLKTASVSDQDAAEKLADLESKTATYDSASARVRQIQDLMSFNRLTAPFDGRITSRTIDVGDLVIAGVGHELFRLADTSKLRVFARVPQSMAPEVSVGQTADLYLPEKPSDHFQAVVTRTAGAIDATSRTLLTELEVDNHEEKLFAGSFAQVRLAALRPSQLLTIPANTLVFRQDGMQIAVVDHNNKVELRNFKPGRDLGYRLEVADGVNPDDRIILNPPDSLTAGVTVRVAPPSGGSKEAK